MKKTIWIGAIAFLLGLSACDKEGYEERSQTVSTPTISILTDESGNVLVSQGYYTYDMTMTNTSNTGTVKSPDLIADNTSLSFTTNKQNFQSTGYDRYFENAEATTAGGLKLSNANFLALYLYDSYYNVYGYYTNTKEIGKYTYNINTITPYITVANYNIGNYKVNTFQQNTFFVGKTTTTYPQSPDPFETEGITYRVMMNRDEETGTYTADMILYDAKFSGVAQEPIKEAILVEGLNVEFSADGITISGEDIEPLVYESGDYTPYPSFVFNYITFKTTNSNYTEAVIDYKVAGVFTGHFEGSYINTYFMK